MEEVSRVGLFDGERGFRIEERSDVFQGFAATGDATRDRQRWVVLLEGGKIFQRSRLAAPHFLPQLFGSPLEVALTMAQTGLLQLNPPAYESDSLTYVHLNLSEGLGC